MTGRLAKSLDAKVCILNHLNVHEQETMHNKVRRVAAAASSGGRIKKDSSAMHSPIVVPAFDFMEVIIPAGGFDFENDSSN